MNWSGQRYISAHSMLWIASLLWLLPLITLSADNGRLFFTEQQRQQFNHEREQSESVNSKSAKTPLTVEKKQQNHTQIPFLPIKLNGMIYRHGGGKTIWINHKKIVVDAESNGNITAHGKSHKTTIALPTGQHIDLLPGQTYQPDQRRITESYEINNAQRKESHSIPIHIHIEKEIVINRQ